MSNTIQKARDAVNALYDPKKTLGGDQVSDLQQLLVLQQKLEYLSSSGEKLKNLLAGETDTRKKPEWEKSLAIINQEVEKIKQKIQKVQKDLEKEAKTSVDIANLYNDTRYLLLKSISSSPILRPPGDVYRNLAPENDLLRLTIA